MFCGNCGTNVLDNAVLCPNCGKSTRGNNIANNNNGFILTNLTAKLFNILFEIILWIILISGFVIGGVRLYNINANLTFLGIIIGGITSFISIILMGGLVSLFIKLVNNSNELKIKWVILLRLTDGNRQPPCLGGSDYTNPHAAVDGNKGG